MSSKQKRQSKGIALTISAVLEALFFIGILGLGYWFFLSRILDIRVTTLSSDNERHAINLANVLLSYEKIAYVQDGIVQRGLLDAVKLDEFASRKGTTYDFNKSEFVSGMLENYKDIGFGYPNSISIVTIVDLESCKEDTGKEDAGCTVWSTTLAGPISAEGLTITKFTKCLIENFKTAPQDWARRAGGCTGFAIGGAIVGSFVPGIGTALGAAIGCGIGFLVTLWDWGDINKCAINTMPESLKYFFSSGSFAAAQGLPMLIRYPDGSVHAGRMIVSVIEWR